MIARWLHRLRRLLRHLHAMLPHRWSAEDQLQYDLFCTYGDDVKPLLEPTARFDYCSVCGRMRWNGVNGGRDCGCS